MPRRVRRPWRIPAWGRLLLVAMALAYAAVFYIAVVLDPYQDGKVWLAGTHRQLGLPECSFKYVTGLPCASCGMSTSFALAIRGDLANSVRANFMGTVMALFGMAFVPWALVSAARGHWLYFRSIERLAIFLILGFLIVFFLRWCTVLVLIGLGW